ncbi:pentapeptide repeat-containing protein [Cellulomonas shaoxiangyii]|nr:pentapeptide repeat-containing protein [Cellulomonas shaoxiangyii]
MAGEPESLRARVGRRDRPVHRMTTAWMKRWATPDGLARQAAATAWLLGDDVPRPEGFGDVDGRVDLRGLSLAPPQVLARYGFRGVSTSVLSGVIELRSNSWSAIDLSGSTLPNLRFFDFTFENCAFVRSRCIDWRLWGSTVRACDFERADLRDALLTSWHEGQTNTWTDVSFRRTNLRGSTTSGGTFDGCAFDDASLRGQEFRQTSFRDCTFAGTLQDVRFDARVVPDMPVADTMRRVDFSRATFQEVYLSGCRFEDVRWPTVQGIRVYPRQYEIMRAALARLEGDERHEAQQMRWIIEPELKFRGAEDSAGVFVREDYVKWGGEPLATLAETLYFPTA